MQRSLMTCQELVELVTDYQEHTLSPSERQRFEEHLALCPPCVTYVEQMVATTRIVGALDEQVATADYTQRLLRHFRAWKREQSQQ